MAQFARPDTTVSSGDWTVSGETSVHLAIDELGANGDTDYVYTSTDEAQAEVTLSDVTDPLKSTGHVIRFVGKASGSGAPEKAELHLYQGATEIAATGNTTITRGSYNTYSYTLSAAEADAITDYTDLKLIIHATNVSGSDEIRVTQAELEVPDATTFVGIQGASGALSSADGAAKADRGFSASLGGVSAFTGGAKVDRGLAGATDAVTSLSGPLALAMKVAGTAGASATTDGILKGVSALYGAADGISTIGGTVKADRWLLGMVVTASNAYAALGALSSLAGTSGGLSYLNALLSATSPNPFIPLVVRESFNPKAASVERRTGVINYSRDIKVAREGAAGGVVKHSGSSKAVKK
ncbi:MAG: hypothetical protein V3W31_10080 [Thermodesulfobacteriota bacterium]